MGIDKIYMKSISLERYRAPLKWKLYIIAGMKTFEGKLTFIFHSNFADPGLVSVWFIEKLRVSLHILISLTKFQFHFD